MSGRSEGVGEVRVAWRGLARGGGGGGGGGSEGGWGAVESPRSSGMVILRLGPGGSGLWEGRGRGARRRQSSEGGRGGSGLAGGGRVGGGGCGLGGEFVRSTGEKRGGGGNGAGVQGVVCGRGCFVAMGRPSLFGKWVAGDGASAVRNLAEPDLMAGKSVMALRIGLDEWFAACWAGRR